MPVKTIASTIYGGNPTLEAFPVGRPCDPLFEIVLPLEGGFPQTSSWLSQHQICVEDDQSFEVKGHGLQEGRELILRHPSIAHALGALSKDLFIRSPQMRIPPVAIPVLGFPVVPLDRGEMAVSLGRGLTGRGRTIPFIPIDRPLCGADMPQALSIRQIGRCRRHFVNQAGLHIHLTCSL